MENISHDLNREIQLLKHFFLMYLPRKTFLKIDDVRKYLQLKNIIPLGDSHKLAERKNLKIILDLIKTENIDLFLGFHNPMMINRYLREYLLNNFLDYINGEKHKPIFEVKGEISIFDNTCNWSIDYPKYFSFDDIVILKSDLDKIYDAIPIIFTTKSNIIEQTLDNDKLIQKQRKTIDRQAKEIADLKSQLEQQANQPCETVLDDEMETKSLNAVSRLVYVLLDMAEYDLSTHSGNGNTSIIARSERLLQKPLSKKFVSDWIKNAQTAKIEYGKK